MIIYGANRICCGPSLSVISKLYKFGGIIILIIILIMIIIIIKNGIIELELIDK